MGNVLDALAQRFLDANAIAYQFITLVVVLGLLLWLQWRLLVLVLSDRVAAAVCFLLTVFMIQPGTYWGLQWIAYHQALPLVFLLATLLVVLRPVSPKLAIPVVLVLSLLVGFAYTSGSAAIIVTAVLLFLFARLVEPPQDRNVTWAALAMLAGGLPALIAQLWVIIGAQHGHLHRPDASWSTPTDPAFWLYILGKIARSLGLQTLPTAVSFALTLGLTLVAFWIGFLLVRRSLRRAPQPLATVRLTVVYTVMLSVVSVYLAMVASGRANLGRPPGESFLQIFMFGYERFHFFWVTLLWPWVAAALLGLAKESGQHRLSTVLKGGLPVIALIAAWSGKVFDHSEAYRRIQDQRLKGDIRCVMLALAEGGKMQCLRGKFDLFPAYLYARSIGASFTRTYPIIPRRSPSEELLFRLSTASPAQWHVNASDLESTSEGWEIGASRDPQIVFTTGAEAKIAMCSEIEVVALIKPTIRDTSQFFYGVPGEAAFSEKRSVKMRVSPKSDSEFLEITFRVKSSAGFVDRFRLDPVAGNQRVIVKEIDLRCR